MAMAYGSSHVPNLEVFLHQKILYICLKWYKRSPVKPSLCNHFIHIILSTHQKLWPMGQKDGDFLFWSMQEPMVKFLRLKITHLLKKRFFLTHLYNLRLICILFTFKFEDLIDKNHPDAVLVVMAVDDFSSYLFAQTVIDRLSR